MLFPAYLIGLFLSDFQMYVLHISLSIAVNLIILSFLFKQLVTINCHGHCVVSSVEFVCETVHDFILERPIFSFFALELLSQDVVVTDLLKG